MTPRALSTYRQTHVQSRTPLELVVMLYDGALTFLARARDAVDRGDISARCEASNRALAIIGELKSTLNLERGGEVARQLDEIYGYVNGCILRAASENTVAPLDDARRVLTTLRDAWATVATPAAQADLRGAA